MTLSAKNWGCDHFMEYIDVYTRDGIPTGKIKEKHEAKLPGEYFRHVLIIMKTADSPVPGEGEGMYIVQQRSLKARYYAGKWDMTGGGVHSGETPDEAAVRDLSEELGIVVKPQDLKLAFDYIKYWDDWQVLYNEDELNYTCSKAVMLWSSFMYNSDRELN